MTQVVHSPKRFARPPGGFTLIELLMVIALIALLIAILMPAYFRISDEVKAVAQRAFIYELTVAGKSYAKDHDDRAPAVVADPTATGMSPSKLSGAQQLRLALLGCSLETDAGVTTIVKKNSGVAPDFKNYHDMSVNRKNYLTRLDPKQTVRHGDLIRKSGDGTDPDIEVFVAHLSTPIRPMLYYRARNKQFTGTFADNACYMSGATETEGNWSVWAAKAKAANEPFFVIWCGRDGEFFNDPNETNRTKRDDYSGLPND